VNASRLASRPGSRITRGQGGWLFLTLQRTCTSYSSASVTGARSLGSPQRINVVGHYLDCTPFHLARHAVKSTPGQAHPSIRAKTPRWAAIMWKKDRTERVTRPSDTSCGQRAQIGARPSQTKAGGQSLDQLVADEIRGQEAPRCRGPNGAFFLAISGRGRACSAVRAGRGQARLPSI
jgi:hypothetical protein